MWDQRLFITSPFMTICEQPGPTRNTAYILYCFCLLRILRMISAMKKWPTKRNFIGKTDLDAAYRQIHANAMTASTCI